MNGLGPKLTAIGRLEKIAYNITFIELIFRSYVTVISEIEQSIKLITNKQNDTYLYAYVCVKHTLYGDIAGSLTLRPTLEYCALLMKVSTDKTVERISCRYLG